MPYMHLSSSDLGDIMLDNTTHIGRSEERRLRSRRDYCHQLLIPDYHISTSHATICLPDNNSPVSTIFDMSSSNGTYVNNKRIDFKTRLYDGDVITIGKTSFHYEMIPQFPMHRGIMVGYAGKTLHGPDNDVLKLRGEFTKRGFSTQVLLEEEATAKNILESIRQQSKQIYPHSVFLFYFSGHCNKDGRLGIHKNWWEGGLKITQVIDVLAEIQAHKFIVLDGCHTLANTLKLPENTAVIGTEAKALEKPIDGTVFMSTNRVMGLTTNALYNLLRTEQHLNTRNIGRYLQENIERQKVCFQGSAFALPTS